MGKRLDRAGREAFLKKLPALWLNPDVTARAIGERFGLTASSVTAAAKELKLGEKPKFRMQQQRRLPLNRRGWGYHP